MEHGLLSGWRLTSLANSVLSCAYVTAGLKLSGVTVTRQKFMGDDYVGVFPDQESYQKFERAMSELGVQFQRSKCLLLRGHCEFLRKMYYPSGHCLRSLARGVANMVAGNWEPSGEVVEDPAQAAQRLVTKCSIIIARGGALRPVLPVLLTRDTRPDFLRRRLWLEKVRSALPQVAALPGLRDLWKADAEMISRHLHLEPDAIVQKLTEDTYQAILQVGDPGPAERNARLAIRTALNPKEFYFGKKQTLAQIYRTYYGAPSQTLSLEVFEAPT